MPLTEAIHIEVSRDVRALLERAASDLNLTLEAYVARILEIEAIERRQIEAVMDDAWNDVTDT